MTGSWVATDACTLPSAEQPLRVAEFDALFGSALRRVERQAPDRLRLELDAGAGSRARDLVARETSCCAFFDFRLTAAGDTLLLDVRVPTARTDVLDGLARRATAARG